MSVKHSKPKISIHLSEIEDVKASHSVGIKKVFLQQGESNSNLTQIAYGSLNAGEQVEFHTHPTMEEYFFFLEGNGIYYVGSEEIELGKGLFVRIPANTAHSLKCTGTNKLEFFYFGIAT